MAAGAAVVDCRTDLGSLTVQGLVAGALVGIAQAVVLLSRLGALVATLLTAVLPLVLTYRFGASHRPTA